MTKITAAVAVSERGRRQERWINHFLSNRANQQQTVVAMVHLLSDHNLEWQGWKWFHIPILSEVFTATAFGSNNKAEGSRRVRVESTAARIPPLSTPPHIFILSSFLWEAFTFIFSVKTNKQRKGGQFRVVFAPSGCADGRRLRVKR